MVVSSLCYCKNTKPRVYLSPHSYSRVHCIFTGLMQMPTEIVLDELMFGAHGQKNEDANPSAEAQKLNENNVNVFNKFIKTTLTFFEDES